MSTKYISYFWYVYSYNTFISDSLIIINKIIIIWYGIMCMLSIIISIEVIRLRKLASSSAIVMGVYNMIDE